MIPHGSSLERQIGPYPHYGYETSLQGVSSYLALLMGFRFSSDTMSTLR